jgi:hypothetical protein
LRQLQPSSHFTQALDATHSSRADRGFGFAAFLFAQKSGNSQK